MECFVALFAIVFLSLSAYFFIRLRELERKSREIEVLKGELHDLRQIFGLEGAVARREKRAHADAREATPQPAAPPLVAKPAPAPQYSFQQPVAAESKATVTPAPTSAPVPTPALAKAVQPAAPAEPFSLEIPRGLADSPFLRWFMGSHMVVRAGIVILFIGVAFLLKYAADQGWLSIELRLAGAGLLGLGLVYAGWRLRAKQRIYALTLQGGGLGIAYLTTFAGFRIYELLPTGVAFALLVVIGMACGVLAVLNDAKALALPAIVGGFAAPLLVSNGDGSHVTLFAYYFLVNCAILLIAWYKSWRELNLVGFLFTVVLASLWGNQFYRPEFYASVEPFLILFFLFYVAIGLLFTLRQPPRLAGLVDGPIVFGTPVVTIIWQALIVREIPYALAWSAAAMGALYLLLTLVLTRASANFAALRQSYLAISTVLLCLAIPFAFDAQVTSALWALAGLGIFWIGTRQKLRFHVLWGGLIQLGAAYYFAAYWVTYLFSDEEGANALNYWFGLFDSMIVGGVLLAVAALITGYLCLAASRRNQHLVTSGDYSLLSWGATVWGLAWWYGIATYGIIKYIAPDTSSIIPLALFVVLSAVVGEWLGGHFHWRAIRLSSLLLWAAIALLALLQAINYGILFTGLGWLVWPAAVLVHYWTLYRLDHVKPLRIYHSIGLWLLAWPVMLEAIVSDYTWAGNDLWAILAVLAAPWLLIVLVSAFGKKLPWPTAKHYLHYMTVALAPFVFLLALWVLVINISHDGDSTPFRYLPLLNPLSLANLLIFGALGLWLVQLRRNIAKPATLRPLWIVGACLVFLWFNGDIARIVHQYWGVPWDFDALLASSLLQAIYSIIWTLLAMAMMFMGTRRASRPLWLTGAALLGITVLKLLLLDLSAADTLARIVSFIVVGLLMLLIGYFSPIPPGVHRPQPLADANGANPAADSERLQVEVDAGSAQPDAAGPPADAPSTLAADASPGS